MAVCDNTGVKNGKLQIIDTASQNPANPQFPYDPCTNYWTCTNLKIFHGGSITFDEATAGFDSSNPTGPQAILNRIQVRVFNVSSNDIHNVNVEAWVCNFTMGVTINSSLSSSNPAHQPMTGFVSVIPAGGSALVTCSPDWVTTQADVMLNGGHVCIAACCYTDPQDPNDNGQAVTPGDIINGPTGSDFNFCCDAHHAQRNIAVRAVPVGQRKEGGFQFKFFADNPDPERELEVVMEIKHATGVHAFGRNEQQLLLSGPHATVLITDDCGCQLVLAGDPRETPIHESHHKPRAVVLEGEGIGRGNILKAVFPPKGRIPMAMFVEFAPEEDLGGFHTFDVTETDTKGNVVGGVRVMTLFVNNPQATPVS